MLQNDQRAAERPIDGPPPDKPKTAACVKDDPEKLAKSTTPPESGSPKPEDAYRKQWGQLLKRLQRAQQGDIKVLPWLRKFLDQNPQSWQQYGDMARRAEREWISLIGGQNIAFIESLIRQTAAMKAELLGNSNSPLERLLVQDLVASWLQLQYADAATAQYRGTSTQMLTFLLKRQAAAQLRFQAATRALSTLRKYLPIRLPVAATAKPDPKQTKLPVPKCNKQTAPAKPLSVFAPDTPVGADDGTPNRIAQFFEPVRTGADSLRTGLGR